MYKTPSSASTLQQSALDFDYFKWTYAHAVRGSISMSLNAWKIANQFKVNIKTRLCVCSAD